MKPRIFISAVTKELRSARQIAANTLIALGYEPVWQDIFGISSDEVRPMLRSKIDSCSAVLQIVGDAYGAEPSVADEDFGRVSYTQYEALYARARGKQVYYLVARQDMPRDAEPELIDAARDESDAARADADKRRQLQCDYRASIQSTGHLYYAVQSHSETELTVRRLKDELERLRRNFRNWMIGVSLALILITGGVTWLNWGQRDLVKSVDEAQKKTLKQIEATGKTTTDEMKAVLHSVRELTNPDALAETIRREIQATAERKIDALGVDQNRIEQISEIEKERDQALRRVRELVEKIQWRLKNGAGPVYQKAADVLQTEGIDAAIVYLESCQEATFKEARRHAEQAKSAQVGIESAKQLRNQALLAVALEADLLESKLQWASSLTLREQIAEIAPDWFEARNGLGLLYSGLARFQEAELHSRAALKIAEHTSDENIALNNLATLLYLSNRLAEAESLYRRALAIDEQQLAFDEPRYAAHCGNFAQLLKSTNRFAEAERFYRRALTIFETSHGTQDVDVATSLFNLAKFLNTTNRIEGAELMYRRALAIDEQLFGSDHPNVATDFNSLAMLLQDTSRLEEAEPLIRRAIVIDEQAYGPAHPVVANSLNSLARLLQGRGWYFEAVPLHRRALLIDELIYGPAHSTVARDLNNLAQALKGWNLLEEAEPLMRRALAIEEQSYGAEHPNVALYLNNLAMLLDVTNRKAEAEPLIRRALQIQEKSYGSGHPEVARALWSLAALLRETDRLNDATAMMRRALTNYRLFKTQTGHEHPHWKSAMGQYRDVLTESKLPAETISEILLEVTASQEPLTPITSEVEKLLGPARSVTSVLEGLDRQYKEDGKSEIYFLRIDQPITAHLDPFLAPTAELLNSKGIDDYLRGDNAWAIMFYDDAIRLQEQTEQQAARLVTRMNRAAALRDLGDFEGARDALRVLLPHMEKAAETSALTKGRTHYQLALCEWRLGDNDAAKREADASLAAYGDDAELATQRSETEQLIAEINSGTLPPPRPTLEPKAALDAVMSIYRARKALMTLSLKDNAVPLLDQLLGKAGSTRDILDSIDLQYRKAGKPDIWFLPLDKPISPHLDEILGPLPPLKTFETGNSSGK